MKCKIGYKTVGIAAVSGALLLGATVSWLVAMPGTSHCPGEGPTNSEQYKAHPVKVVVRPWLGPHQVFGIFVVPLRYRSGMSYFGTISVKNYNSEFAPDHQIEVRQVDDLVVEPGYYLIRGYIPTRVALWFFLTGQLGDLRTPCNWTLEFIERAPANANIPLR